MCIKFGECLIWKNETITKVTMHYLTLLIGLFAKISRDERKTSI